MRHVINEMILAMRFGTAYWTTLFALGLCSLSLKMLPKDHPSRVYFNGRVEIARRRAAVALRSK